MYTCGDNPDIQSYVHRSYRIRAFSRRSATSEPSCIIGIRQRWIIPLSKWIMTVSKFLKSVTLWLCQNSYGKWPFIVDFPIKNGDFP